MRLQNKVAIITGSASGIGLESCFLFAQEGAKVVACDINETMGKQIVAKINEKFPNSTIFCRVDVSVEADLKKAVDLAFSTFGSLNIMFNNAGIMHGNDDNAETTEEFVWDLTMKINVKGVWYGCKHAIPAIRKSGGGSIINTASFVGKLGAATPQIACIILLI